MSAETDFPDDPAFAGDVRTAIAGLFDAPAAVRVLTDPACAAPLLPVERIGTARFAPARLAEYRAGRDCARRALALLGHEPVGIARAADRSPIWPASVVGSITHSGNLVAAVAAWIRDIRSLGLDIERWQPLPPGIADLILAPGEGADVPVEHAATLRFSAKEALYKCQYPLTGRFLDFAEVALAFVPLSSTGGRFSARLVDGGHPAAPVVAAITGRWRSGPGWIATGASLPVDR